MLSAIVLAAGLSSRMGTANKLLLPYRNKTVVEIVVETLLEAGLKEIIIVTGHEADHVRSCLDYLPVKFIHNHDYASGMTSSIKHGVNASEGNGYMICLSDMVTITTAEYQFVVDAFEKRLLVDAMCICVPQYKNDTGNPVIFSAFYKEAILQNRKPEGCKNIVQSHQDHIHVIDMNTPHILQDFDNPDDYGKLRQTDIP